MEGFREVYKLKLPDCDLGDVYDQKYLLLEIVNSEKKKRTWIVLSGRKRYHSGIFADFEGGRLRRKGEEIKIHGGGILVIKKNNVERSVKTYGSSGGYGRVSKFEIVRKCLETRKDFVVEEVIATDYIRD